MVKIISKRTVSNRLVSKFLDIPNTTLNLLCQTEELTAEAKPGRGKKRALTFNDVLTLRIAIALRRITGQELAPAAKLVATAKEMANKFTILTRAGHDVDFTCIIQFGYELLTVTNVPSSWLSPKDEDCIDVAEYLKGPYCAVTIFLLQPLCDEVFDFFETVEKHHEEKVAARAVAAKEKLKLKRETKP